jgi:hypothetical protein
MLLSGQKKEPMGGRDGEEKQFIYFYFYLNYNIGKIVINSPNLEFSIPNINIKLGYWQHIF